MHIRKIRSAAVRRGAIALAVTAAVGLTGACGNGSDADKAAAQTHTAPNGQVYDGADLAFARQMIPHHSQAVQMVIMTQGRTLDPPVRQLAEDIRAAQVPEVTTMAGWLTGWGKKVPETAIDHANADHSDGHMDGDQVQGMPGMKGMDDMPGMMTAKEMHQLSNASAAEFQDMWLRMMIKHHEGAIDMARQEREQGSFKPALRLAQSIVSTQQNEIEKMKGMLD